LVNETYLMMLRAIPVRKLRNVREQLDEQRLAVAHEIAKRRGRSDSQDARHAQHRIIAERVVLLDAALEKETE